MHELRLPQVLWPVGRLLIRFAQLRRYRLCIGQLLLIFAGIFIFVFFLFLLLPKLCVLLPLGLKASSDL